MSLHELAAVELAARIKAGELSSSEVTAHYLDRIARLDDDLESFVTVTRDLAMQQAGEADDAVRAGLPLAALHGVPIAIKDNLDVEDVPTGWGIPDRRDQALADDHVVARIRAGHMPILGKTNMPELALPCHTEHSEGRNTRNPWSPEHTPGGSSGGSAAAVAAGLAPVAIGTDAGGSVRIPASCCGIFGLRPSNGTLSSSPGDMAVTGLSSPGLFSRSVEDARALLSVASGVGPGDRMAARAGARLNAPIRVGYSTRPMTPGVSVADSCVAAVEEAAAALSEVGCVITEVDLGDDWEISEAFRDAWSVVAASHPVIDEAPLEPFTAMMRARGRAVSGVRLHEVLEMFHGVALMLEGFVFGAVDVVLTPTVAHPPPPLGTFRAGDQESNFARMKEFMPFTPMYNIAGMPSISIPYSSSAGLPVGVMVGSAHGQETVLLDLAATLIPGQSPLASQWVER